MRSIATAAAACAALLLGMADGSQAQGVGFRVVGGFNRSTLAVENAPEANVGARWGTTIGALLSLDLSPSVSVLAGAMYVQKGGTLDENGVEIVRDDFNFGNFPILAQVAIPTSGSGSLRVHLAAGPAIEPDFVWGGTGLCLLLLGGVDVQLGPAALTVDLAYNRGMYDMTYTSLGRALRTRTVSLLVGYGVWFLGGGY